MNLVLIKAQECPHCKAGVVAESCERRHCNGQGFEVRRFACGMTLAWCPNGGRLEVKTPCPKSEEELAKAEDRETAGIALLTFIRDLKIDDEYKAYLIRWSPYDVLRLKNRVPNFPNFDG